MWRNERRDPRHTEQMYYWCRMPQVQPVCTFDTVPCACCGIRYPVCNICRQTPCSKSRTPARKEDLAATNCTDPPKKSIATNVSFNTCANANSSRKGMSSTFTPHVRANAPTQKKAIVSHTSTAHSDVRRFVLPHNCPLTFLHVVPPRHDIFSYAMLQKVQLSRATFQQESHLHIYTHVARKKRDRYDETGTHYV